MNGRILIVWISEVLIGKFSGVKYLRCFTQTSEIKNKKDKHLKNFFYRPHNKTWKKNPE